VKIALIYDRAATRTSSPSEDLRATIRDIRRCLGAIEIPVSRPLLDFVRRLERAKPDLVFNLCEGIDGDSSGEATVAGVLELVGIPFTGNPSRALRTALDKARTKELLRAKGIPTPRWAVADATGFHGPDPVRFPAIVKPRHEDASMGIDRRSVVRNRRELAERVEHVISRWRQEALVEEYVDGRETNVALLGGRVLAASEIRFSIEPRIVTYDAKWKPGSPEDLGTTPVPATPPKRIAAIATAAAAALGCTGPVRVDLRDDFVIDVNPNPDLARDAGFARSARASGISYEDLLERILDAHTPAHR
jgi:D-alanine-D-alanine ligase